MKRLLFIILCCTHIIIHANKLSDAIRENDLETVSLLLSKQKIEPADYAKYVAITEESIQLAREQLLLQKLRPKMRHRYILQALASMGAMIGSMAFIFHEHGRIIIPVIMIGSFITMCASMATGFNEINDYCKKKYDTALKIQDLILDL
jgi:hypothetical protein